MCVPLWDLGRVGLAEQKLMPRRGESQKVQMNLLFTAFHIHELALKSNNNSNNKTLFIGSWKCGVG